MATGRRILRSLFEPALKGVATSGKVLVADSSTNVTGLTLTNATLITPVTSSKTITSVGTTAAATVNLAIGNTYGFNALAGVTGTLPAATGSGGIIKIFVQRVNTSLAHVVTAKTNAGFIQGTVLLNDAATVTGYVGGATVNYVSLNGTTTGGLTIGDYIEFTDFATNLWMITGICNASGTAATPLSAT